MSSSQLYPFLTLKYAKAVPVGSHHVANYQICELAFLHNSGSDAVAQFRHHENVFFQKEAGLYPSRELAAIELSLWRSQQVEYAKKMRLHLINLSADYLPSYLRERSLMD